MDAVLGQIDDALIRLRRLWATPRRRIEFQRDVGEGVPLSHVLVIDAVTRIDDLREVTIGAVADQLSINESTASRLVDASVRGGLIDRSRSGEDARRAVLTLTEDGRALFDRARRYRHAQLSDLLAGWSTGDRADLARLLGRFADAVHAAPPAADG